MSIGIYFYIKFTLPPLFSLIKNFPPHFRKGIILTCVFIWLYMHKINPRNTPTTTATRNINFHKLLFVFLTIIVITTKNEAWNLGIIVILFGKNGWYKGYKWWISPLKLGIRVFLSLIFETNRSSLLFLLARRLFRPDAV